MVPSLEAEPSPRGLGPLPASRPARSFLSVGVDQWSEHCTVLLGALPMTFFLLHTDWLGDGRCNGQLVGSPE